MATGLIECSRASETAETWRACPLERSGDSKAGGVLSARVVVEVDREQVNEWVSEREGYE